MQPTKEQWKSLYEAAIDIQKAEPWKRLYDTDLVTIQLPEREEPVFCSVMGAFGECYAIGVYPGYEALSGLIKMNESQGLPPNIILGYSNCLLCYFGSRNELADEEVQIIRDLGLKFRGANNWIFFKSHKPGYYPWFIDAEQCELMTKALQHLLMALSALQEGTEVDFTRGETLLHEYSEERGIWITHAAPPPKIPMCKTYIKVDNEAVLENLRKAKATTAILECELCFLNSPVQDKEDERPYLPVIRILADVNRQILLQGTLLNKGEDESRAMVDMIVDHICKNGRPQAIHARDEKAAGIIADLCRKTGIKLVKKKHLPLIDDFLMSMNDFMR